jgi:hypothetical protein
MTAAIQPPPFWQLSTSGPLSGEWSQRYCRRGSELDTDLTSFALVRGVMDSLPAGCEGLRADCRIGEDPAQRIATTQLDECQPPQNTVQYQPANTLPNRDHPQSA